MSESTEQSNRLNIDEQLARIENLLDESSKFRAESRKFERERTVSVMVAAAAIAGAFAALGGFMVKFLSPHTGMGG